MYDMYLIKSFDEALVRAINGLAGKSHALDGFMYLVSDYELVKGLVPALLMWFLWFRKSDRQAEDRLLLMSAVFVSCVAIAVGRAAQLLLPFRHRPIYSDIDFLTLPLGTIGTVQDGWSSFPSDHAVFYCALAVAILFCSRAIGLFLFAHALLVACLPRIYLGLHYPSDIVGGAIVGVVIALVLTRPVANHVLPKVRLLDWERLHPETFYPFMFFVAFQIGSMFKSLRALASIKEFL